MFFSRQAHIGLAVTSTGIRLASLYKSKTWQVNSLHLLTENQQSAQIQQHMKSARVVASFCAKDLLIRLCDTPLKKTQDILAALDFHAEPLLPYPLEKGVIQAHILERQKDKSIFSLCALRKDRLQSYLQQLARYGLDPEVVISSAHALAAFSTLLPQKEEPLLLVHETGEEMTFALVEKGALLSARSIELRKDLTTEIQKTLLHFSSVCKNKNFDNIYFCGHQKPLKELLATLSEKHVIFPSCDALNITQAELIDYCIAIGSALAYNGINFRQKEFSYSNPWKHLKKPVALCCSLALVATFSFWGFVQMRLQRVQQSLAQSYFSLMEAEKNALPASSSTAPLSLEEYHERLNILEKKIITTPDLFALTPQTPTVKELLSWLTTLAPNVPEGSAIDIETFHYQMIKHPDFSRKKETYKVRIEMEFNASAHVAKALQEAMKTPNPLVDIKEGIEWLPLKSRYKVVFYLKDTTRYYP